MVQICRLTGNQHPITTTHMHNREVVALDAAQLDTEARTLLEQQPAVERVQTLKTPYQLVSRAFQAESTQIVIGTTHGSTRVTIGGDHTARDHGWPLRGRKSGISCYQPHKRSSKLVHRYYVVVHSNHAHPPTSSRVWESKGYICWPKPETMTGLPVITEVMEPAMVEAVAQHADILQMGARNMQNYPLLLAVGRHSKQAASATQAWTLLHD